MLSDVSTANLELLVDEVESGDLSVPLTIPALLSRGLSCLAPHIDVLQSLDQSGLLVLCKSILAEREHRIPPAELVWTGPQGAKGAARSTEVVFRDLLRSARKSVWMAGYAVDHGADLFAPLYEVMKEHGVKAKFLLNIEGGAKHSADIHGEARLSNQRVRARELALRRTDAQVLLRPANARPESLCEHACQNPRSRRRTRTDWLSQLHQSWPDPKHRSRRVASRFGFAKALVTQFQSLVDGKLHPRLRRRPGAARLTSNMQQATLDTVLLALTKDRMRDVGRRVGVALRSGTKKDYAARLTESHRLPFRDLLAQMKRDELRAACRAHELDDSGRARQELMQRLLDAHGDAGTIPPAPLFTTHVPDRYNPKAGDTVRARHRQWLVDEVWPPPKEGDATRVRLTCLDDDNRGAVTELLWELELGAEVIRPEAELLRKVDQIDDPRQFAAYYHALQWQGVTATERGRFQSPFRAGIQIQTYQLTPLQKALSLPRANLFIADDVGLGKTIEAGLVLQELLLRQQVDFALIVCPASVTLQWRDEMEQRFGLSFEVYTRDFVLARRRERGFGVNPWTTHNRFIISYPLIRRPEYRDPLLQHLGERVKKSLLILDEAHTVAPASASQYAVDSRITRVARDIAPRFENRLFLSATPHNGHSNSFSALLEILDPQRFTRGVPVSGPEALEPVMVRRLKKDLKAISTTRVPFPDRDVVRIALHHDGHAWAASFGKTPAKPLGEAEPFDLRLSELLAEYTALMTGKTQKRRRLTFINLQKRLLSSVAAFHRTLELHAKAVGHVKPRALSVESDEEVADAQTAEGIDEESSNEREDTKLVADSAAIDAPEERAKELLEEMRTVSRAHRREPDAKVKALLAWMREQQCPGISLTDPPAKSDRSWTDRRVLIFTEYGDTRRYLRDLLRTAVADTDRGDERILEIYGGMNDEAREEVQYAFNAPPDDHPVRILIATDAAREGLNLQGHCADLFHIDIPWNPSRMEQRNGRIDRALQPEPVVRCHYFVYEQRGEDRVLDKVVEKTEVIQRELGSLGTVVLERVEKCAGRGHHRENGRPTRPSHRSRWRRTARND